MWGSRWRRGLGIIGACRSRWRQRGRRRPGRHRCRGRLWGSRRRSARRGRLQRRYGSLRRTGRPWRAWTLPSGRRRQRRCWRLWREGRNLHSFVDQPIAGRLRMQRRFRLLGRNRFDRRKRRSNCHTRRRNAGGRRRCTRARNNAVHRRDRSPSTLGPNIANSVSRNRTILRRAFRDINRPSDIRPRNARSIGASRRNIPANMKRTCNYAATRRNKRRLLNRLCFSRFRVNRSTRSRGGRFTKQLSHSRNSIWRKHHIGSTAARRSAHLAANRTDSCSFGKGIGHQRRRGRYRLRSLAKTGSFNRAIEERKRAINSRANPKIGRKQAFC